jgi:long-chain acyl-CoA synthetase
MTSGTVPRPWLDHYPPGVPAEVKADLYPSLASLLEESFRRFGRRRAAVCLDQAITFGEIDQLSEQLAAWLQSKSLAKGARVALMMPNLPQ